MLDLHIHDAHFVRLMFGMPTALDTQGRWRGEVLEYFQTQFRFADPSLVVSATSGVINQQGRSFLHGYEIHFEDATLVFEFGVLADEGRSIMPLTVIPRTGDNQQVDLGSGDPMMDAFENELNAVATAVESGTPSEFLDRRSSTRRYSHLSQAERIRPLGQACGVLETAIEGLQQRWH